MHDCEINMNYFFYRRFADYYKYNIKVKNLSCFTLNNKFDSKQCINEKSANLRLEEQYIKIKKGIEINPNPFALQFTNKTTVNILELIPF